MKRQELLSRQYVKGFIASCGSGADSFGLLRFYDWYPSFSDCYSICCYAIYRPAEIRRLISLGRCCNLQKGYTRWISWGSLISSVVRSCWFSIIACAMPCGRYNCRWIFVWKALDIWLSSESITLLSRIRDPDHVFIFNFRCCLGRYAIMVGGIDKNHGMESGAKRT
jgi:hypothetical protein